MAKALVISALKSGEGKTLVTLGLLRLLRKRGLKIQPFKVGPDYIDPKWHTLASGLPSYNLDLFAMSPEGLRNFFYSKIEGVDWAIVEGVMGLFDGSYSTFRVAKALNIPVVLVIDSYGLAESVGPLIRGITERLKRANLAYGILLNRVSSERHLLRLCKAIRREPLLGYLPLEKALELPSRHLGLLRPEDVSYAQEIVDKVAETLERGLNLELIEKFSQRAYPKGKVPQFLPRLPYTKIAIAFDRVFNFYYQHLLEELKNQAEVSTFSPLEDEAIPSGVQAIYIGGGYPELFAKELTSNKKMLRELKLWIETGCPLYAECGGLIYLSKLLDWEGKRYSLVGALPFYIRKGSLSLGYRLVKPLEKIPFFECQAPFFTHEFHYTQIIESTARNLRRIYLVKTLDKFTYQEGFRYKNTLASYLHLIAFKF
ncbi:MAG: cobyrinate a,c-diamide synthase [Caldimicrobium sp.]|nr:cobyrinate a,c-diamide synthase [Caldimicrobium sp.]MCX7872913.1 cobyrinate a,c-diamide synthase [Caldimicrobium sp.]MDW8094486.1 cobyrinate a,c-diamide synthase [Caldimicrobium sp.]